MVKLANEDILTREVLDWEGVHLLHFMGSSCSQKTRIFLNLKGIDWVSHHLDLTQRENNTDWFMGINPRGLVPVLVHDGDVIIESNDILEYLEETFPAQPLIPATSNEEVHQLLMMENDLHLDLRAISMRYLFDVEKAMRSDEELQNYDAKGSGTVQGVEDAHKAVELQFHREVRDNNGVPDDRIIEAANRFRDAFSQMESRLETHAYLLGDNISVLDIAWFIYAARLIACGYPLADLHENLGRWYHALNKNPAFHIEVQLPPPLIAWRDEQHEKFLQQGTRLIDVANLDTYFID
jgi:glutathione S-transferase